MDNHKFDHFADFKSEEVDRSANLLGAGRHDVIITQILKITDRTSFKGKQKTQEELDKRNMDWKDEHSQLGVVFSKAGAGVASERFNFVGFKRYDELADKTGFFQSAYEEPYAIDEKSGERVIDPERSAKAKNILYELFDACQGKSEQTGEWEDLPLGSGVDSLVGCRLSIEVVPKQYDNRDVNPDVRNFRKWGTSPSGAIIDHIHKDEQVEDTVEEEVTAEQEAKRDF